MTFSPHPPVRWSLSLLWVALALSAIGIFESSSVEGLLALAAAGVVPPAVLLAIWNDGPPATIAEVLHATEGRR
jgi:hypothetical protein